MIDHEYMSNLFRSHLALPMKAQAEPSSRRWRANSPAGEREAQAMRYELMQSTHYRFESILFHFALLALVEAGHIETLREVSDHSARRGPLKVAVTQVRFVFDDIVMLVVVLFDYFAGFAAMSLAGPEYASMKWAQLLEETRVRTPAKRKKEHLRTLRESRVARLPASENGNWLKGLASYRGAIAHAASPKLEGRLERHWARDGVPTDDITLHVHTPMSFIDRVPGVPAGPDGGRAEIGPTSEWLIERAFLLAKDLCVALEGDLLSTS
jgi:hypothetical protein